VAVTLGMIHPGVMHGGAPKEQHACMHSALHLCLQQVLHALNHRHHSMASGESCNQDVRPLWMLVSRCNIFSP
jgi:hypothetical protein